MDLFEMLLDVSTRNEVERLKRTIEKSTFEKQLNKENNMTQIPHLKERVEWAQDMLKDQNIVWQVLEDNIWYDLRIEPIWDSNKKYRRKPAVNKIYIAVYSDRGELHTSSVYYNKKLLEQNYSDKTILKILEVDIEE